MLRRFFFLFLLLAQGCTKAAPPELGSQAGEPPAAVVDSDAGWVAVTPANACGQGVPAGWVLVGSGRRNGGRVVWANPDQLPKEVH